ncbi:MAG: MFS transporter [Dehalococcoidia bacterium]|nr:MFS transporter [Dehalococcoidia bacterium]|tara:strand:+ start:1891 stop:3489 length:1599 start_codon:yes stop_codon:yes gene_type:complete
MTEPLPLDKPIFGDFTKRKKIIIMAGAMIGLLMAALDQTVVATALPQVVADLGGFDRFAWVFTAYMLASTALIPIMGKLSDIYGRKWVLTGGAAIFMIGSVLCGTAFTMNQLIIYRAIQGIGAASLMANSFTILADLFPPAERGKWQGLFGATFALASVIGPVTGGYITDNFEWRWIFLINVPVGIVTIIFLLLTMPSIHHQSNKGTIDFAGASVLILLVVPFLLALTLGGDLYDWTSLQIILMFLWSLIMLPCFVIIERRASNPIIPLWVFRNPVYSVSIFAIFMTGLGMFGGVVFVPLFIQGVVGSSATNSGAVIVPMSLAIVLSSTIAGQLIARTGHYKIFGSMGLGVMAFGLYLLADLGADSTEWLAVRNMIVVGLGLGITFPVYVIAVQNSFEHRFAGIVTSTTQFFRQIGGTMGVAIMGSILAVNVGRSMNEAVSQTPGADNLSNDVLLALGNPQLLIDIESKSKIQEALTSDPNTALAFSDLLEALRISLAESISNVFLLSMVFVLIAFLASFFVKEVALKGREH